MRRNSNLARALLILIIGSVCLFLASAHAQEPQAAPSLGDQLKAQYTTVKTCADSGTVLVVQQPGITGFPQTNLKIPETRYREGKITPPKFNVFTRQIYKNMTPFNSGLKVKPTNIAVDVSGDTVSITVLACSFGYKAVVIFEFEKGALQKMGVPEVQDVVARVFTFDQSGEPDPPPQTQAQPDPQMGSPDQPQEPPKVHLGETTDEVIAALGQPEKKIDLGPKQIFIYKDLKITFRDGKVADAE